VVVEDLLCLRVPDAPEHLVPELPLTVPEKMKLAPMVECVQIVFDELSVI
jgi:hypothetical protein